MLVAKWEKPSNLNPIKSNYLVLRNMKKTQMSLNTMTNPGQTHLLMMAGGHQMLQQMNWIKSIANLTNTVHILFGTYELLNPDFSQVRKKRLG